MIIIFHTLKDKDFLSFLTSLFNGTLFDLFMVFYIQWGSVVSPKIPMKLKILREIYGNQKEMCLMLFGYTVCPLAALKLWCIKFYFRFFLFFSYFLMHLGNEKQSEQEFIYINFRIIYSRIRAFRVTRHIIYAFKRK